MKINQYRETDMRRALQRIREELGGDAVILSTRKVGKQVEVLAAVDYDQDIANRLQAELPHSGEVSSTSAHKEPDPLGLEKSGRYMPTDLSGMQAELSRLRGLFEQELSELSWHEQGRRSSDSALIQLRLDQLGIDRTLSRSLLPDATQSGDPELVWQQVLSNLAQGIQVPEERLVETGGVCALVGPTGVGKTTTVAKIAARFALKHGRNEVALVSADRYRVGAQEQLYTYGSLLGVPVQAATTAEDLERVLHSFSERKLILIDTAGMNHRDLELMEQIRALLPQSSSVNTLLVQSATTQISVLQEVFQAFSPMELSGVIVTKIDEAASLGPIISVLSSQGLPLECVGNGQRVPEDILMARPALLVEEAVRLLQSYEKAYQSEAQELVQYA